MDSSWAARMVPRAIRQRQSRFPKSHAASRLPAMDNITHTLIGAMVGDIADRSLPRDAAGLPARTRRTLGIGLMIVGSNLPDADFPGDLPCET